MESIGGLPDEVRVTLSVLGRDLDPSQVHRTTGIEATRSFRRGDRIFSNGPEMPHGAWIYTLEQSDCPDPDAMIRAVLASVPVASSAWQDLARANEVTVSVAMHSAAWSHGLSLSPQTIQSLSSLGCGVNIASYLDDETPSGV